MSGFMKASVAVGQGREDATVRIQRDVKGLKESSSTEGREQIPEDCGREEASIGLGDWNAWSWPSGSTAVLLAGMGKVGGNVGWWSIYGQMSPRYPKERTGPQQELQSHLPSQVWGSENGVF